MRRFPALVLIAAMFAAAPLDGQGSPYLPRHDWATPYLEHLISLRIIPDPSPLIRPFRRRDARAALARADTAGASGAVRRLVQRLARQLASDPDSALWFRLEAAGGVLASTHARRTAVRDSGDGDAWHRGDLTGTGAAGPLAFGSRLEWDWRLEADPDYGGAITREVAVPNRFRDAYASAQFSMAEVFVGQVDRNWGPGFVEGLILSDAPYSYDHVFARLGPPHAHVGLVATQLDDVADPTGTPSHRYFVLHSLYLRLPLHLSVNLWEGTLFAGPNRQFEIWFLNPFKLANRTWRDEGGLANNNLVGGDFVLAPPRWPRLYFSLFIDDFPPGAGDDEPTSGALTAGLEGGVADVVVTAFYTAVANLTYRAAQSDETVMRRGVGLGRNQSDYDQATLTAALMPVAGLLLRAEATVVRQGEGDFRQPFPPAASFPTTPVLHQGVVERLMRLGLAGRLAVSVGPAVGSLTFEAAYHRFANAGHQSGLTDDRFVGSLGAEVRLGWARAITAP